MYKIILFFKYFLFAVSCQKKLCEYIDSSTSPEELDKLVGGRNVC